MVQKLILVFGKSDNAGLNRRECNFLPRILEEAKQKFEDNEDDTETDMETFYHFLAEQLTISQAQRMLEPDNVIEMLIIRYKFAPLPPRPKVRNHISKNLDPNPSNIDDDPSAVGYESVCNLNVIARAILVFPELLNVWRQNGYHEVVEDTNDYVIRGLLQILYPTDPPVGWCVD